MALKYFFILFNRLNKYKYIFEKNDGLKATISVIRFFLFFFFVNLSPFASTKMKTKNIFILKNDLSTIK